MNLEQLAQNNTLVLLDNNIFNVDMNYSQIPRYGVRDLGSSLGASRSFKDIRLSKLARNNILAKQLLVLAKSYESLTLTKGVLDEFNEFNNHLKGVRKYVGRKSSARKGDKSRIFDELISVRDEMSKIFYKRLCDSSDLDHFSMFLKDNKMHLPRNKSFNRSNSKYAKLTGDVDANLFAQAVMSSLDRDQRVSVISNDLDVILMALNLRRFIVDGEDKFDQSAKSMLENQRIEVPYNRRRIPDSIEYMKEYGPIVKLYMPHKDSWIPDLDLREAVLLGEN
jgi:hypothetical protein